MNLCCLMDCLKSILQVENDYMELLKDSLSNSNVNVNVNVNICVECCCFFYMFIVIMIMYKKYKIQYLETRLIGGNVDTIPNLEIISELASGGNGTTYLVNYKGDKMIYKLERMDIYDESKPTSSEYCRQIDFNENVCSKHPNKFMVLKGHGILKDCSYAHPQTSELLSRFKGDRLLRFERKMRQPNCYYLLYSPILDRSFSAMRNKVQNDEILFIDFIRQIVESINIMRKEGYSQNDLSANNIMCIRDRECVSGYRWFVIDYGNISHPKFASSLLDDEKKTTLFRNKDLLAFIHINCISENLREFLRYHTSGWIPFFESDLYKKVSLLFRKSLGDDKLLNILCRIYCQIKHPIEFLRCYSLSEEVISEFENKQLCVDVLINCLLHCEDENYDLLLSKIST